MSYVSDIRKKIGHDPLLIVGASVIVVNEKGQTLLQRRADNGLWNYHGGCTELYENVETAARRELLEEVGATAGQWTDLGTLIPSPGCYGERLYLFLARDLTFSRQHLDEGEFLEASFVPLDELARGSDDKTYDLPRAKIEGAPYDMSFSGLKTAVVNIVHNAEQRGVAIDRPGLAASFAAAVSDTLVPRAMAAAAELGYDRISVAGGVAANSRIRRDLEAAAAKAGKRLYMPPLRLCGDNGAMIASQGYFEYLAGARAGMDLNAYATMRVDRAVY